MTTGESAGYIVCEGITIPIDRIDIRCGQIEFTASCQGPVRAVEGGPVTIFGSDGHGFCQGGLLSWDEARAGEQLVVVIRLSMDRINSRPRPDTPDGSDARTERRTQLDGLGGGTG